MNLSLLIVLIVIVMAVVFYSRNRVSASQSLDGQVIIQLLKAGSSIKKPHNIEFFFYFPTQANAENVASKLIAEGFSATAQQTANSNDFVVQATKTMVPIEADLVSLREKFVTLSASENGVYDGWGTEIE